MSDLSLMSITNSFFASAAIFDFSFSFFPQKFAKKNLAQIEIDSLKSILLQNLPNPNLKKFLNLNSRTNFGDTWIET